MRSSDYRRAAILISLALKESKADDTIVEVFRTAAEWAVICKCHKTKSKSNINPSPSQCHLYIHATLCAQLFSSPKTMSHTKMFGRYFHSLACHVPVVNRIVPLRSINTEAQECMFNQCKQITKSTSNLNPKHVITNIILWIQEEEKAYSNILTQFRAEESQIEKLVGWLGPKENTIIPMSWLQHNAVQFQAHLECINDFLMDGPGSLMSTQVVQTTPTQTILCSTTEHLWLTLTSIFDKSGRIVTSNTHAPFFLRWFLTPSH